MHSTSQHLGGELGRLLERELEDIHTKAASGVVTQAMPKALVVDGVTFRYVSLSSRSEHKN